MGQLNSGRFSLEMDHSALLGGSQKSTPTTSPLRPLTRHTSTNDIADYVDGPPSIVRLTGEVGLLSADGYGDQLSGGPGAGHDQELQRPGAIDGGYDSSRSVQRGGHFKGGVPYATAILQGALVVVYVVWLWATRVLADATGGSAGSIAPWYRELSVRVSFHGILYILVGCIGLYIFYRHKQSQARGYLRFYRSINMLRRLPIFTMSIFNVLLLPLWVLTAREVIQVQDADWVLRALVSVEAAVVVPCFLRYSLRVREHNKSSPLPDVEQVMSSSFEHSRRPRANDVDDSPVVRRWQADVVRWQQVKITDLQHQVLSLVERNQQLERKQSILAESQRRLLGQNESGLQTFNSSQRREFLTSISMDRGMDIGAGSSNGGKAGNHQLVAQVEQLLREQQRLQDLLRDERRKVKRTEHALLVEREMKGEAQRIIESMHAMGGGHTTSSSMGPAGTSSSEM